MLTPETKVLVVDQERFARLIVKMLESKCRAECAFDGGEAVRKLRASMPDVLLIEQNVPGGGLRLAELVGMNPDYAGVPVILTSARPSPDIIIQARNAGVSSYLAKPFRPSELLKRIEVALAAPAPARPGKEDVEDAESDQADEGAAEIGSRVSQIDGLPPFPATHAEILKLTKSDTSSSDDLAEKIQMDPSFLATVLKLANSSYYGATHRITSLKMAITRLGLEEISNLVMAAQVFKNLGGYEDGGGLDVEEFWKHSVGTAFAARAIAKKLSTEVEGAFLSGMMHDLGKVVLDRFFSEYYREVIEHVRTNDNVFLLDAEKQLMGVTHAQVGGQLADAWNFAENFTTAITSHHTPVGIRRYQRLVSVVHMADIFCRELEYGSGGDTAVPDIDDRVLDRFNIGERGRETLKETVASDLEDADSFLSGLRG